jgi:hypothetical protein
MRRLFMISASLSALTAMAACNIHDPLPMGRGYSSYNEPYKSALGAPARDVGYGYSNEANKIVIASMRPAVEDLVEKLDQKLSFNIDAINLRQPAHTAFYNSLDHLLREELTKRGYLLSIDNDDAVTLDLYANDDVAVCKGDAVYIALAIDVIDDAPSDIIGGFYNIPKYDFIPAGHLKVDVPTCIE